MPPGVTVNATQNATSAERARWWIYSVDRFSIITIRMSVQVAESGATLRVGTYNLDDDLRPSTLVEDYGTMNASSTGIKSIVGTFPVIGRFAVALWASNHANVRYTRASATLVEAHYLFGDASAYANNQGYCWGVDSVDYSGGFPAVAPAVTIQSATTNLMMPAISIS
jgi:hypothetical protein